MHIHRLAHSLRPLAAFVGCLLTITFPVVAAADRSPTVIRWIDAQGQIHFSDRTPPEAAGTTTRVTVDPDHNVVPAPPTPHFVPFKPARPKHRNSGRSERAAAAKARHCARDKEQLQRLHDRMLAGYTARQYNGLMQRKRNLEKRTATDCH